MDTHVGEHATRGQQLLAELKGSRDADALDDGVATLSVGQVPDVLYEEVDTHGAAINNLVGAQV